MFEKANAGQRRTNTCWGLPFGVSMAAVHLTGVEHVISVVLTGPEPKPVQKRT
jgi:hypothetical protein